VDFSFWKISKTTNADKIGQVAGEIEQICFLKKSHTLPGPYLQRDLEKWIEFGISGFIIGEILHLLNVNIFLN
jgi:hypothetical protein